MQEQSATESREVRKTCPVCGEPFIGLARRVYCTTQCFNRAAYLRNADKRKAAQRERYARKKSAD